MTVNAVLERARAVVASLPPLVSRPRVSYDDLVDVLREPRALFGEPSQTVKIDDVECRGLDWDWLAEVLNEVVAFRAIPCTTIMEIVQIAADMARQKGVAMCSGAAVTVRVSDAGTEDVELQYILRLDASHHVAAELDDALTWRLCEQDMCRPGFTFSFAGIWTEEDRRRLRLCVEALGSEMEERRDADFQS